MNVAIVFSLVGGFLYYVIRMMRGDYPFFADNIVIPLMGVFILHVLMFVLSNTVFYFITKKVFFPVALVPTTRDGISTRVINSIFVLVFLLFFLVLLTSIASGDHFGIPVVVFYFYLFTIFRTCILQRYNKTRDIFV
jgi:hypothetical protein